MSFSILGDRRSCLPPSWSRETSVGLVGDAEIDASAGAGPGAVLTIVSIAGDARVRVPPGTSLALRGFNVLGDRKVRIKQGTGPDVTVKMYSLFGDLDITDGLD